MGTKRVGWARIKSLINENQNQIKIRNDKVVAATTATLTADQSGATILWDASAAGTILTLPAAATGLNFRIILKDTVHTDDDCQITVTAGDCFYGVITVQSPSQRNVIAGQSVTYDTATTTPGSYDYLNFSPDSNATGGLSGDVLHLTAVDATAWHVEAFLHTAGTAPASVAVIGAS